MTVRKLIEKLGEFHPDLPVASRKWNESIVDIQSPFLERMKADNGVYQEAENSDPLAADTVIIMGQD
jgi:hypothetical protein